MRTLIIRGHQYGSGFIILVSEIKSKRTESIVLNTHHKSELKSGKGGNGKYIVARELAPQRPESCKRIQ